MFKDWQAYNFSFEHLPYTGPLLFLFLKLSFPYFATAPPSKEDLTPGPSDLFA